MLTSASFTMARLTHGWVAWMWVRSFTGSASMKMTILISWALMTAEHPSPRRREPSPANPDTIAAGTAGFDGAHARKITDWTTLDLILNYTFNYPAPAPAEVPGYAKDGGKNVTMKDGKEKNVVPVSTA